MASKAQRRAAAQAAAQAATTPAVTPAPAVTTAPAALVTAPTVPATNGTPATPGVLQVKAGANLRGARAAWYAVLLAHNGKPVADFLAATAANPPSMPTKGALAGKGEPPKGWLGWFVRNGWASVVAPGTTAAPATTGTDPQPVVA